MKPLFALAVLVTSGCVLTNGRLRPVGDPTWSQISCTPVSATAETALTVHVDDQEGLFIPGTWITVRGPTDRDAVTDERGEARMVLPPGSYTVKTQLEGLISHTASVEIRSDRACTVRISLAFAPSQP